MVLEGERVVQVKENTLLAVDCQATGIPKPLIIWKRDGKTLETRDSRLIISSPKASDAGRWARSESKTIKYLCAWKQTNILQLESKLRDLISLDILVKREMKRVKLRLILKLMYSLNQDFALSIQTSECVRVNVHVLNAKLTGIPIQLSRKFASFFLFSSQIAQLIVLKYLIIDWWINDLKLYWKYLFLEFLWWFRW